MRLISFLIVIHSLNIFASSIDSSQFNIYLDNMKSVIIDFEQSDSKGGKANGTLLIHKPYKFRCNYHSPFPLLIIGNKNYLSVYDYDMETTTRVKAEENIFNFLLLDGQNLTKYFNFKSIKNNRDELILTLNHIESGKDSIITFDKNLKQIAKIEIFEVDNIITLNFNNLLQVEKFDDDLFILKNSDIFGPPKRLGKEELKGKYK